MSAYDWDPRPVHYPQHHQHQQHQQHQQQHQHQHQQQQRFDVVERPRPEPKGGKRSRQTYSKYQTAVLETVFRTSKYIVRSKRQQMSAELDLTERQIKIWFQNRRMKEKKCRNDAQRIDARRPVAAAKTDRGGYDDDDDHDDRDDDDDDHDEDDDDPLAVPSTLRDDDPFAGYDVQLMTQGPAVDPYGGDFCKPQQWPARPAVTGFRQDFYGHDHDPDRFLQPFQTPDAHHHHRGPLISQVPDYCNGMAPQQLQAAHGY